MNEEARNYEAERELIEESEGYKVEALSADEVAHKSITQDALPEPVVGEDGSYTYFMYDAALSKIIAITIGAGESASGLAEFDSGVTQGNREYYGMIDKLSELKKKNTEDPDIDETGGGIESYADPNMNVERQVLGINDPAVEAEEEFAAKLRYVRQRTKEAMKQLLPQQQELVERRYGKNGKTLQAIADEDGVTRQAIFYREDKIKKRIGKILGEENIDDSFFIRHKH